ncbi:hypothetical protein EW026_g6083 [Hermanssonia centrifuga]|uniref:Uncharacterized protein n=2 Tax=Hermanssonia centrifuga TaxID=98765 RepID=A0A4S4KC66_9APHY|nr:hypothetical protein PHLCEN_2v8139 [Hermanssonia centrifuga]THG95605.1 hypothetical protein EW026_g6083 [Hermanssonia centrifuga]
MRPTTNIYPARTYHKLSLDTGSFNTASFRPWHNPAQDNFGIIHFRAPSTSYDILLGINALDMADSTDLSLKCSLLSFADNSARLNLQSWGNTIQYSSGCSWLSVPADDPDFQSGRYYTIDHQQWSKPQVSTRIVFKRSYPSPPKVVVWLDTIHTDANTNCRAHVYPSDVATDGFTLHLDTWHDTKLHLAGATWVAHSSDRTDIHSGSFCTEDVKTTAHPQLENSARIAFNGANFSSSPRIFMALNKLDIGRQRNLRVSPVHASDVTNTGMTWHLNSWAETELFSAGASFVAYEK